MNEINYPSDAFALVEAAMEQAKTEERDAIYKDIQAAAKKNGVVEGSYRQYGVNIALNAIVIRKTS